MQRSVYVLLVMLCLLGTLQCRRARNKGKNWRNDDSFGISKSSSPDSQSSDNDRGAELESVLDWNAKLTGFHRNSRRKGIWLKLLESFRTDCQLVKCSSCDYGFAECSIPGASEIRRVKLVEKLSREECFERRSFGVDEGKMWVDRGCRAVFVVCFRRDLEHFPDEIKQWDAADREQFIEDIKEWNAGGDWYVANTCEPDIPDETSTEPPDEPEPEPSDTTPSPCMVTGESRICVEAMCPPGYSKTEAYACESATSMCCEIPTTVTCDLPPLYNDDRYNIVLSDDGKTATYTCADSSETETLTCVNGVWPGLNILC